MSIHNICFHGEIGKNNAIFLCLLCFVGGGVAVVFSALLHPDRPKLYGELYGVFGLSGCNSVKS